MTFHEKMPKGQGLGLFLVTAFFVAVFARCTLKTHMTVCMGYPAMTLRRRAGKRRRKGGRKAMQGERQDVDFPVAE